MIIIWAAMGILLIVLVAGGFVGRHRRRGRLSEEEHSATHATHNRKKNHKSRGRGQGH